ncbi:RICIN domain-containing protein [Streptomyces sp. TLI_185]|uniref:RICIN domain-containing protein n=1 Tax=Streptomyces sp. TLI_185 TaxID=2485151 RepID=UPI000F4F2A88|nr:RICIN domain-containing protein [Streptomyces sp. TLI_185]RPF38223.1 lysophospholipase L1-like esterase [Streptomyces sp. TLI_185]
MRTTRHLAVPVGLSLAACALTGTGATAHAASAAPVSGTVYTLTNVASKKLMDVKLASTAPGAPVIQYTSNNGANQQWLLTRTSSGAYTVRSANSGLCLDTPAPQSETTQLVQNTCDGAGDQQWKLQPAGDAYNLVNAANGLVVDNKQSSDKDENEIIQWPSNGGDNQRWTLTPVSAPLTRVGTYTAGLMKNGESFTDKSIRMVAHTTVAGSQLRVRLSNRYGTGPLTIDAVDLAREGSTPGTAVRGTHRTVLFNKSASVTLPAGQDIASDPIPMAVAADTNQLVSLHVSGTSPAATWHQEAQQTAWVASGNHVDDDGLGNYPTNKWSWYFLEGLDVISSTATGTLVCVGDSITDGVGSPGGTNRRWPDHLARRMNSAPGGPTLGVVNAGIGSNRILTDAWWTNPSLRSRFGRDVLGQPNVKSVILLEGINDIGSYINQDGQPLTAKNLEDGIQSVIDQAHAVGVKIFVGTILPFKTPDAAADGGKWKSSYWNTTKVKNPTGEQIRLDVNHWIRSNISVDGVFDFATTMADPNDPQQLNPAYDSGDHLHPNGAGYQAMANAVDLAQLRP